MESILIVDDEPLVLEGIRSKLDWEALGFDRVETATDGYQALRLVEQSPPSVLLTDIRMPYLDGLALCKAVRTLTPETKIIIMTGHDEFPYAQDALRLGASDFVLKPVTAEELSIILQEVNSQLQGAVGTAGSGALARAVAGKPAAFARKVSSPPAQGTAPTRGMDETSPGIQYRFYRSLVVDLGCQS